MWKKSREERGSPLNVLLKLQIYVVLLLYSFYWFRRRLFLVNSTLQCRFRMSSLYAFYFFDLLRALVFSLQASSQLPSPWRTATRSSAFWSSSSVLQVPEINNSCRWPEGSRGNRLFLDIYLFSGVRGSWSTQTILQNILHQ